MKQFKEHAKCMACETSRSSDCIRVFAINSGRKIAGEGPSSEVTVCIDNNECIAFGEAWMKEFENVSENA